ncbi:unnamed protein product [Prorocentrum cordatum]|uniref:Uncharacterized protein n=1 Tax=Prorocentrum cordatum TaxID=2364126 RepID=A0ABN9U1W5_9DINO|nr:unnamed protein product [Polarella glacialis]
MPPADWLAGCSHGGFGLQQTKHRDKPAQGLDAHAMRENSARAPDARARSCPCPPPALMIRERLDARRLRDSSSPGQLWFGPPRGLDQELSFTTPSPHDSGL